MTEVVTPVGECTAPISPAAHQPLPPFLRWAGGKRWLTPHIKRLVGTERFSRYHEPFLGGGSVFFSLAGYAQASQLSDLNAELITVYRRVRDNPDIVASLLSEYENTSECYYEARATAPATDDELAARFIFLNHTSFNGIYRVNLKGEYNVPFGKRARINLPDLDVLRAASSRLKNVDLFAGSFETALADVQGGELVFLDPPYTVAHNNNGFVKYNQHLFSFEDQQLLASCIEQIVSRGAKYILTNAAHQSIDDLFSPLGRKEIVSRRNAVGGVNAGRGRAEEFLFTNIGDS